MALFEPEADLERDLEVRHLAIDDMPARIGHFIPVHVLDRQRRLGNGIAYGLIAALRRRANQLDQLVSVCGHDVSPR